MPAPFQACFELKHRNAWLSLAGLTAVALLAVPVQAEDLTFDTPSKAPVPRWAMLRRNEVYARNGPSKDNAKVWTYRVASLPVQIISETRDWRLICDPDGGVAWVSKTMLQAPRTVMSPFQTKLSLHAGADEGSPVRAIVRPKVLAQLVKCKKDWCKVSVDGVSGWAPQASLWGTQTTAVCTRPNPFASN